MLIKEAKKRFNAKQIAAELVKRKVLTECICGIMFEVKVTLYYIIFVEFLVVLLLKTE